MHILVTDATGTLGRLVARQLIAAGHSVAAFLTIPTPVWTQRSSLFAHR